MQFADLVVSPSSQCSVKFVDSVESSRCFVGWSSLSSWFALWGLYCFIVYTRIADRFTDARCVCRVVPEILSASE